MRSFVPAVIAAWLIAGPPVAAQDAAPPAPTKPPAAAAPTPGPAAPPRGPIPYTELAGPPAPRPRAAPTPATPTPRPAAPAAAPAPPAAAATRSSPGARLQPGQPIPPAELAAFVDGQVKAAMARDHIAGVTVSVVQNGQVLLKKGYGFASLSPRKPVDPDRTLFRLGSLSKTFTWIGLRKQAEAGRIRLDQPVNLYLPDYLRTPDQGFEQPMRVLDLMDHAAGFEDRILGHLFEEDADYVRPLETFWVLVHTPRPGELVRDPWEVKEKAGSSEAFVLARFHRDTPVTSTRPGDRPVRRRLPRLTVPAATGGDSNSRPRRDQAARVLSRPAAGR